MGFAIITVGRFKDIDSTRTLIGTFTLEDDAPGDLSVPVAVEWDPGSQRYRIHGLLRSGAGVAEFRIDGRPVRGVDESWYRDAAKLFGEPVRLNASLSAWGASALLFKRTAEAYAPLLLGLYRLTAGNSAPVDDKDGFNPSAVVYQRAAWSFYTNSLGELLAGNCGITGERLTADDATQEDLLKRLARVVADVIDGCDTDPSQP